jgi:hypothetical protein
MGHRSSLRIESTEVNIKINSTVVNIKALKDTEFVPMRRLGGIWNAVLD